LNCQDHDDIIVRFQTFFQSGHRFISNQLTLHTASVIVAKAHERKAGMEQLTDQELKLVFHHIPFFSHVFFQDDSAVIREHEDMNKPHVHAVIYLKMNGPSAMSTVARFLNLEKGSFTPIANRLINWGYVTRELDHEDHRRFLLQLTDSGREFANRLRIERSEHFATQIDKLSSTQRKQFFAALAQIQQLLTKINGQPAEHHCPTDRHNRTTKE
jgi:DNA-binding MarR family transcriptional regulator